MNRRILLLAAGLLAVGACQEDPRRAESLVIRDSAGVRILISPDAGVGLPWGISPEAILVLGADEGRPDELFQHVTEARFGPAGSIVVADLTSRRVIQFSESGELVGILGGPGEGPGEFRAPSRVFFSGDTIVVVEGMLVRAQSFLDGEVIEVRRGPLRDLVGASTAGISLPRGRAAWDRLEDGSVLMEVRGWVDAEPGATRESVLLARWRPHESRVDSLLVLRGGPVQVRVNAEGRVIADVPHLAGRLTGIASNGMVHTNDGLSWGLTTYDQDGEVIRISRVDRPLEALTQQVQSRWRDHMLARFGQQNEAAPSRLRELFDESPFADSIGSYSSLVADQLGRVWAQELVGEDWDRVPNAYHVFDRDGRYLGPVSVPEGLRVTDATEDRLAGVHVDAQDVQTVRIYRLLPLAYDSAR